MSAPTVNARFHPEVDSELLSEQNREGVTHEFGHWLHGDDPIGTTWPEGEHWMAHVYFGPGSLYEAEHPTHQSAVDALVAHARRRDDDRKDGP